MPLTQQQITAIFEIILRREPRPQEVRILTSGEYAEGKIADSLLIQATEIRSIARLYISILGGYPDGLEEPYTGKDGLTFWVGKLRAFRNDHLNIPYKAVLQHTIIDWFDTDRHNFVYSAKNTREEFLDMLCRQALGRPPTKREWQGWGDTKDWGTAAKAQLAVEISESQECKLRFNPNIDDRLRRLAIASCLAAANS
jgi:hypothetical protein